jgi:hypothetical protein
MSSLSFPITEVNYNDIALSRDLFIYKESDYKKYVTFFKSYFDKWESKMHPNWLLDYRIASVEARYPDYLVINLCVDILERYHSVIVTLPKKHFKACFENEADKQEGIIVSDDWFNNFKKPCFASFCMVDAIGVKNFLTKQGYIEKATFDNFRNDVTRTSRKFKDFLVVSLADSVIIQSKFKGNIMYYIDYAPERLVLFAFEIQKLFKKHFRLNSYAVFSQGNILDFGGRNLRKKIFSNHYSFASLGTPFSQLFDLDEVIRVNCKNGTHSPCEAYFTDRFFWTLKFNQNDTKDKVKANPVPYQAKLSFTSNEYYYYNKMESLILLLGDYKFKNFISRFHFSIKNKIEMKLKCSISLFKIRKKYTKKALDKMLTKGPSF